MDTHAKSRYVTYRLEYHFVWWSDPPILEDLVASLVEKELRKICLEHRWDVSSLQIAPTKVDLVLCAKPSEAPSLIVNLLKGATAKQVFKQFPEMRQRIGAHLWARLFFVESIGQISDSVSPAGTDAGGQETYENSAGEGNAKHRQGK